MKKVLLSIVLAAMTLSANAADDQREYESLLSESKVWTMSYQGVVNPEVYGDIYHFTDTKLVGDTVINNIHFMRKYQRQWSLGRRHPQIGLPRMSIWGRMGERSIGIPTGLRMWCWIWMCL